jgi:hypothetical protein
VETDPLNSPLAALPAGAETTLGELETPAAVVPGRDPIAIDERAVPDAALIDPEVFELVFETGIVPDGSGPWDGAPFDDWPA